MTAAPLLVALVAIAPLVAHAGGLEAELGRNEVRVWSAPFTIEIGASVTGTGLPRRLELRGYRRVHERPTRAGEYFWGHESFWFHRRAHRIGRRSHGEELIGLRLRREDGTILDRLRPDGSPWGKRRVPEPWLEPLLLSESLAPDRAVRLPVKLSDLPEHVWRAVLAAEDARFFDHVGLDGRSLARALLKNVEAGEVVQGGSTITQQLVKVRDLSPKRTLGRKVSEAVRALGLEAEHDKREILQAYLNVVYLGHAEGLALHGIGTAARAYFSKDAHELSPGEAALLAGMIQGPNSLAPDRHPERALERQRWVLSRLEELGWAGAAELGEARARGLPGLRPESPRRPEAGQILGWLREEVSRVAPGRMADGRGVVVLTTLDPLLQSMAERAVAGGLRDVRRRTSRGRNDDSISAALVTLDATTGEVLAYVGGDPARGRDTFDRARQARRQPGSSVKPFVLLESFRTCGGRDALYPARRVRDRPVTIELPSGDWTPENSGRDFRGVVTVREALVDSLNVPFVRIGRWCGFEPTADRMRAAGFALPRPAPPSFVLGAVETTPLEMAQAYTVFGTLGRRLRATPFLRIDKPSGRNISKMRRSAKRVSDGASAYLVRDLLRDAIERGTGSAARIPGHEAAGKTGTSSGIRDAWFAGFVGNLLTLVWVGADDGGRLGLGGSSAAAPIWREFMAQAVEVRRIEPPERPGSVVEHWVQDSTGLLVGGRRDDAHVDLFRRGSEPPRRRLLRRDRALPVVE